jgi:hypothetical protein
MSWLLFSMVLLPVAAYGAVNLWRRSRVQPQNSLGIYPEVELAKESSWFLLNLAVVNDSAKDVWAEECLISLSECDGPPSSGFHATYQAVLPIREIARPGETFRIGLCQTVYIAAGRPQDDYSFVIAGTLKCRVGHVWHSQSFRRRRVMMRGPYPVAIQEMQQRSLTEKMDNGETSLLETGNH